MAERTSTSPPGVGLEARVAARLGGSRIVAFLALCAASAVVGVAIAIQPVGAALAVVALLVLTILLVIGSRVAAVFVGLLAFMLVGYAFLGRGFAYVGAAPIYIGEVGLPLAILAVLRARQPGRLQLLHLPLLAFMGWGALQTIPYLGVHGINAFRDAVTWGYAVYAVAVSFVLTPAHIRAGVALYRRAIPPFLVWVPILAALTAFATLPSVPGSDVPFAIFKGGDVGVHLAGVGAFVLLGMYGQGAGWRLAEPLLWAVWLVAIGVVGIFNRGGLVAASMSAATMLYIRAAGRWLTLIFVAVILAVPLILIDPKVELGTGRQVSVGQMIDNVTSLFGQTDDAGLEGTKEFRLRWWGTIVDYTIFGPYFWTGKGYGINLADDDGFQPTADRSLRSPHNVHIEILARSGVPGIALWILLNAAFGLGLLRAAAKARRQGDTFWVQVVGFVSIYWLAALVNASFDPYLQGPQGGIWFWTIVGVGLAAIRMVQRSEEEGPPDHETARR